MTNEMQGDFIRMKLPETALSGIEDQLIWLPAPKL